MNYFTGYGSLNIKSSRVAGAGTLSKSVVTLYNNGYTIDQINGFVGYTLVINMFTPNRMLLTNIVEIDSFGAGDPPDTFSLKVDKPIAYGSSYHWKIVDSSADPTSRVVNYKIYVDNKNIFEFVNSNEWVIYHTFTEDSYYGNKFYPTLGGTLCYDENDKQIYPTDIIYCPETITNGIFEGGKVIVKWAAPQSGKAVFNSGFGSNEAKDQSRYIIPISYKRWAGATEGYDVSVSLDSSARSTACNIIEPFMTPDAISNGQIVQMALLEYEITDTKKPTYCAVLRIKSTLKYIDDLDKLCKNAVDVNKDILNVITISSTNETDLFKNGANSFLSSYQDKLFRTDFNTFWYMDRDQFNPAADINLSKYNDLRKTVSTINPMFVDNIGYTYNPTGRYKFKLSFYLHGVSSPSGLNDLLFNYSDLSDVPISDASFKTDVYTYETYKPMLKLKGVEGWVKITEKRREFATRLTTDGFYEAEFLLEFPCAFYSYSFRNSFNSCYVNDFTGKLKARTDTKPDAYYYQYSQIFYPQSMTRQGGFKEEPNERDASLTGGFTFSTLVESDIDLSTYIRNYGGYEKTPQRNLPGKTSFKYPSNVVYREVVPNELSFFPNSGSPYYYINILSGSSYDNSTIPPNRDMKLFILYSNKKWKYAQDKYESYSSRENPAHVFEIDANSLFAEYQDKYSTTPTLPDIKRWIKPYVRGYAKLENVARTERQELYNSDSELVLEIWDNVTNNWRSITRSMNDVGARIGTYINDYRTFRYGGTKIKPGNSAHIIRNGVKL